MLRPTKEDGNVPLLGHTGGRVLWAPPESLQDRAPHSQSVSRKRDAVFSLRSKYYDYSDPDGSGRLSRELVDFGPTFECYENDEIYDVPRMTYWGVTPSVWINSFGSKEALARLLLKQSMDLNKALTVADRVCGKTNELMMVAEDDFEWCADIAKWSELLNRVRSLNSKFSAIKLSYGLGGIIMQCRDLFAVRVFMEAHTGTWPVDGLLAIFAKGDTTAGDAYFKGRPWIAYRYVLGEHMAGASQQSTLGREPDALGETWPRCIADVTEMGNVGATANEFPPESMPPWSNFGVLRKGLNWSYEEEKDEDRVEERTEHHCLRPIVVNLLAEAVGRHEAFEVAKAEYKDTNAMFVTIESDEKKIHTMSPDLRSRRDPGDFWSQVSPEVEVAETDGFNFVKRPYVTLNPEYARSKKHNHVLRDSFTWGEAASIKDMMDACIRDRRCKAFDTHGNLYNCSGGCENNCCEMLTSLTYDQMGAPCPSQTGLINCVSKETALWVKYNKSTTQDQSHAFEPYSHTTPANFQILAKQSSRFLTTGHSRTGIPCLNVLLLTVPRPTPQGETPLFTRSLRSLAALNASMVAIWPRGE